MAANELHIRIQAEPLAYWFIIGCLTLFGIMCMTSFINRINYAGPDEYFMGTMGTFCLWAAVRSYSYFTHPNLSVTKDSITYRPFWSPKRHLAFHGIDHFVYRCDDIEPRSYLFRRSGTPTGRLLTIHRLTAFPMSGKPTTIILPSFQNHQIQAILSAISLNSTRKIRHA
ncbi:hypothetical protein ASD8599_02818 [Ascidiaceihabitans donghaensis]|uniref:Uncharacterized protein n=1 Tax=Ascidiaceihabitans donghaensis TaxID=1510460 RepID=A0A2R8BG79_9RHOB|nr:hypothetical protein [Ascidiaceihabitans donghaensis]SPH22071.1 hypothetical protein ASD8599_02818 [Ascidiaceihabitans donghaensis]